MASDLLDVHVVLDVQTPAVPLNLGNMAIFVVSPADPGTGNGSGDGGETETASVDTSNVLEDVILSSYEEISDIGIDLGVEADAIAKGFFAQTGHGKKLYIYGVANSLDASETTKKFDLVSGDDWEFASIIPGIDNDITALSNGIEAIGRKFLVLSGTGFEGEASETIAKLKALGEAPFIDNTRTLMIIGTDKDAQYNIGALVGAIGNKTPGSVTWKFKGLQGSTPLIVSGAVVKQAVDSHVNLYVNKAGKDQTSEGLTLSGDYIDALHADDWIRAELETEVQKLLQDNDKITFDATGIGQIEAVVTTVLRTATENGIILVDSETGMGKFTVTALSRDQMSAADVASRKYNGLSFEYTRAGAIHDVTIHGTIDNI
ncbi:DUF3383 domain-containing protein [Weissella coleopterorum]|uniref:DUF3383 domain-containing protein n=1 Tax=Weissella coleopterorum TaxID=2714949 RepID=A0A6G8AZ06_9LACO|nr:DUF3383 family protein [Weissella coleopterorum]QIL50113.1 DUF3383 domain-containing protein [Weissella coleopterorum]